MASPVSGESLKTPAEAKCERAAARVIVSATTLGRGGIKTHLKLLCRVLRGHGVSVSIFATGSDWDPGSVTELNDLGVRFHLPPAKLRPARRLASIYSTLTWPLFVPKRTNSLYCIGAGRSHFVMNRLKPRGSVSINHEIVTPPGADSLAGKCARCLDVSVANSTKVAQTMRQYWPEKAVRVIPFLTSDQSVPAPQHRPAAGERMLRVTYLGRLVQQKRPDRLVRRWRELSSKAGLWPARLDVHGYDPAGNMFRELRNFVAAAGVGDLIKIHGGYELADLAGILNASDLVVLPSLWEGLPLVLVEAMLKGVPFVATAAGGTEELGLENPDVTVTRTEWADFERGLVETAQKIREGQVDSLRLHHWAEERYGFDAVSRSWLECLLRPEQFFYGAG